MNGLLVQAREVRHEYLTDALAVELSRKTDISVRGWLILSAAFQITRPVAAVPLPILKITE